MKRALKALLRKLEAIQEEHDGLGNTDVRDHMGDDVRRGFCHPRGVGQLAGDVLAQPAELLGAGRIRPENTCTFRRAMPAPAIHWTPAR